MRVEERPGFIRDTLREQAGGFLRGVAGRLWRWIEKRRSRARLLELSGEQLRDIGLTPEDVKAESAKSWFWHV